MLTPIRVYYEDTDCGGVVYYANYLRYFERGRTEFLRGRGVSLASLHKRGVVFVVVNAEIKYLSPCVYDDLLSLETALQKVSGASITFSHVIKKEGAEKASVRGAVTLACVGKDGLPMRIPEEVKKALTGME